MSARPASGVVHDLERVSEPARGEQPHARAGSGHDRIDRHRCPVSQSVGRSQQLHARQVKALSGNVNCREEPSRRVGGRGRSLPHGDHPGVTHDHTIGERATDVHSD